MQFPLLAIYLAIGVSGSHLVHSQFHDFILTAEFVAVYLAAAWIACKRPAHPIALAITGLTLSISLWRAWQLREQPAHCALYLIIAAFIVAAEVLSKKNSWTRRSN